MQAFTVHLSFLSFLKLSSLIGFCFGVACIPIIILAGYAQLGFVIIPVAVIAGPLAGVTDGFIVGLLGFPVYYWLSRGIGFESEGNIYVHGQNGAGATHS